MTVQPTSVTVQPTPPGALPVPVESDAGGLRGLSQWFEAARTADQLARPLVRSAFVPAAFKPRTDPRATVEEKQEAYETAVANATGAILLGQSLGLDPLTALQNIYVVHGRPGMYAKLKVALAQAAGHRVWTEESTDDAVQVVGVRRGTDVEVRVRITMEQARTAGWTTNDAYRKTPQDMLYARAASRVVDRIAADLLHGIVSVEDIDPDEPVPAAQRVTVAQVRDAAAAEPRAVEAAADPGPPPQAVHLDEQPPAEAEPITQVQWRAINARFVELGVTGPGQTARRLGAVSHLVQRDIDRGSALTADEAVFVLDNLASFDHHTIRRIAVDSTPPAPHSDPQPDTMPEPEPVDEPFSDGPPAVLEASSLPAGTPADEVRLPDPGDGDDPWAPRS